MAHSETYLGTFSQMQTIVETINELCTGAGIDISASYVTPEDAGYSAGCGGIEFSHDGNVIAKIDNASASNMALRSYGETWSITSSGSMGSQSALAENILSAFICGKTLVITRGVGTTNAQKYGGGIIFAESKNGKMCVIVTQTGTASTTTFPGMFNSAFGVAEYDDNQGEFAELKTLNGLTGVQAYPYYRGNFMYNYPIFTQTNDPNYFPDVYVCGVCQYYDKPTYADAGGEKYLFFGHIAIKDTE